MPSAHRAREGGETPLQKESRIAKPLVAASCLIQRLVAGKQASPQLPSWFQSMDVPLHHTQTPGIILGHRLPCCSEKQCPGSHRLKGQHTTSSILPWAQNSLWSTKVWLGRLVATETGKMFLRSQLKKRINLLLPRTAIRAGHPEPLTPHLWRRRIFFAPFKLAECHVPHHKTATDQYYWKGKRKLLCYL